MKIIAKMRTDFPEKFGVPRQSGLVKGLEGRIVFEKKYRNEQALRGLEGYSYLWILWKFDTDDKHKKPDDNIEENKDDNKDGDAFVAMVKPPRLGGNKRMGVFATRSPFRPNPIGLSSVKIEEIVTKGKDAPYIIVSGIDMVDGTKIYDIKPYISYTDCHQDAMSGFAGEVYGHGLDVIFPEKMKELIQPQKREALMEVLSQDPRPGYTHNDENREYGLSFDRYNIRFTVKEATLTVLKVEDEKDSNRDNSSR